MKIQSLRSAIVLVSLVLGAANAMADAPTEILTPAPPATPRINGARVYGERPGRPFLFTIPATGDEPITYSASGLPPGLSLDSQTGQITGVVAGAGHFDVTLTATNARGSDAKPLHIIIGDEIALTPPMGWNSWNCFAGSVDQKRVAAAAEAMARTGLIRHGWTYINIDDTWQGERLPDGDHALQPNKKFPDMPGLCEEIHHLGLKAGIYSTPWITSYAGFCGGSSDNPDGSWSRSKYAPGYKAFWKDGAICFADADAKQYAKWGVDYLKYDWHPITVEQTKLMSDALRGSGRDIVFSLSNRADITTAGDLVTLSNCWRTTGDIEDTWQSMSERGFSQDPWAAYAGPGHWNDPDMLVVGRVGWGSHLHPTHLTPDEQYTHVSIWSLQSAPLLIGCDLTQLDAFTLSLLSNDEVIAVDQDPLGRPARRLAMNPHGGEVWIKDLADHSKAIGLFNRGKTELTVSVKWSDLGLTDAQNVRDLWRQADQGACDTAYSAKVDPHGVVLIRVTPQ